MIIFMQLTHEYCPRAGIRDLCIFMANARFCLTIIFGSIVFLLMSDVRADESSAGINLDEGKDSAKRHLAPLEGKKIAVIGTAQNSKMGAALYGKNGVVVINDLARWPESLYLKKVIVTGTLTSKSYKFHKPNVSPPALPEGKWYFISHDSSRVHEGK